MVHKGRPNLHPWDSTGQQGVGGGGTFGRFDAQLTTMQLIMRPIVELPLERVEAQQSCVHLNDETAASECNVQNVQCTVQWRDRCFRMYLAFHQIAVQAPASIHLFVLLSLLILCWHAI